MGRQSERFEFKRSIGHLLNRCVIQLRQQVSHTFQKDEHDVTPEEWALLNCLWKDDAQSQAELASNTLKEKSTVVRLLDRMETKGFVRRQPSSEDARRKSIVLTRLGRSLETKLVPLAVEVIDEMTGGIREEEIRAACSLLERMSANLAKREGRTSLSNKRMQSP